MFTRAGLRVVGAARRSLDTLRLSIDANGAITVDASVVRPGGHDNPQRAVKFPGSERTRA